MDFEDVVVTLAMLYGGIERSSYRLIGGHSGNLSLSEAIIWTDEILTEPTEQQVIDWEVLRLQEIDNENQLETDFNNSVMSNPISKSDIIIAFDILNDLTVAFLNGQTPTTSTVYAQFVSRLTGTNLQTAVTNYVTMITGLTNFGSGIPDGEKQLIMRTVVGFLTTNVVVWLGKNM